MIRGVIEFYYSIPIRMRTLAAVIGTGIIGFGLWRVSKLYIMKPMLLSYIFPKIGFMKAIQVYEFSFFIMISVIFYFVALAFLYTPQRKQDRSRIDYLLDMLGNKSKEMQDMNDELICKRRMLREVIDAIPMFIFGKTLDGKFFVVNKAVANCYGTHPKNLIDKTDADFNVETTEVVRFLLDDERCIVNKEIINVQEVITCANGKRTLMTRKTPLKSWTGAEGVLGISQDITDIVKLVEELETHCHRKQIIMSTLKSMMGGIQ